MGRYVFDHSWEGERARLALLEKIFDPGTIRHLDGLGVGPGWRCLEVGAGAGSVARWLCERVGAGGRVVATDLKTGFLEPLADEFGCLEVLRHDVVADDLEDDAFDLVHARLLLEHLPERDLAVKRLVAALAPGGVLILEDFDWGSLAPRPGPGADLFERTCAALRDLMEANGYTPWLGRRLPGLLADAGLERVGAEGRALIGLPGTPAADWWPLTFQSVRDALVARGAVTHVDLDEMVALCSTPGFSWQYPLLVAAWGWRPAP
ncbi:MAG: methyltransferase domain-containing protein [Actinomycetota bacterium]|nr:methyltransferase domain-containing protein [Actinomycetota bacterium]